MALGKKKTRRRMSWDEWYKLAKEYRDSHDDLLIPRDYVCDAGQKLGRRIERQRTQYNDVPATQYYMEHGKLPNWPRDLKAPDGRSMFGWINTQRTKLGEGKMPPSQKERLALIDIRAPSIQNYGTNSVRVFRLIPAA